MDFEKFNLDKTIFIKIKDLEKRVALLEAALNNRKKEEKKTKLRKTGWGSK